MGHPNILPARRDIAANGAAPWLALLLATLVLGLIGRTLPQINVLVVGFSLNALLTVACLVVSLGAIAWAFPQETVSAIDMLRDAIRAVASVGTPTALHGK